MGWAQTQSGSRLHTVSSLQPHTGYVPMSKLFIPQLVSLCTFIFRNKVLTELPRGLDEMTGREPRSVPVMKQ